MMEKTVIWPVYLEVRKTKGEGRIISRRNAVKSPKLEEIERVAKMLDLEPVVEKEKAYPKTHWDKRGRVLVNKISKKGEIVKEIAKGIKEMRGNPREGKNTK